MKEGDGHRAADPGCRTPTATAGATESLTVTDNRTGKTYELPIEDGTVRGLDLRQIKVNEDEFGLMSYDPAFTNTASCRSSVTYIDGDAGILEHRGYSIEQLCERSTFLEVAYLLIFGELPTRPQLDRWIFDITHHTYVHEDLKQLFEGFRYDAHPMGMLLSGVGALSTFYPDAKQIDDPEERYMAAVRLIAKVPTLAAFSYRHNMGFPYAYPDNDLNFSENFLSMMFKKTEARHVPKEALSKALDVLFILHADHEQNCSTNAVRGVGSSDVDPYSAVAAGVAALYGPLHGGANEAVLRMLRRIEIAGQHPGLPRAGEGARGETDGLRPPGLQELRPAGADHPAAHGRGLRGDRVQPAGRDRPRARETRARRRLLHLAQALPERRLLLGDHLRGDGDPRPTCSR